MEDQSKSTGRSRFSIFDPRLSILIFSLLAGCGNAIDTGQSTALDSADLITMTDQMSHSILGDAAIQQAIVLHGPLKIVVEPVVNQMHAQVLPRGAADAFTARLRTLLSHQAPDKFTWILNLDAFRKLRSQELDDVEPGPSPEEVNPEFALTATFTSMADETEQSRSDYYVCNFSLTSLKDRSVLWNGSYEIHKRSLKGFLD